MKTSMKTIAVSILAAAALVASGTAAQAGEGGAAGSVSLQFNTNFSGATPTNAAGFTANQTLIRVVRESSSIAVGKNGAVSSAASGSGVAATPTGTQGGNVAGDTITSAIGTGGSITVTSAAAAAPSYTVVNEVGGLGGLGVAQGNSLTPASPTGGANISKTTLTIP